MTSRLRVLILPGLDNSGPKHWQSLWEASQPFSALGAFVERVRISNFTEPEFETWRKELQADLARDSKPTLLVAHSLGCVLAANVELPPHVKGALLVAPANPSRKGFPERVKNFFVPKARLDVPSVLVASETDPYADMEWSQSLAKALGAHFVSAGPVGHINADSGLGAFHLGQDLLVELIKQTE